jgi:lambda repressor-like predicted transcriptional regulator
MTLEQNSKIVKDRIKNSGFTAKAVACQAGINPMTLQRYFTQATMSLNNLQAVCEVVGLEIIIQPKKSEYESA